MTTDVVALAGLVIAVASLIVSIIAVIIPQFRTEVVRVRQKVWDVQPEIYFHVSSISGPGGFSYLVNIENRGQTEAHEPVVYLPSAAESPALRPGRIHVGFSKAFSVGLLPDASIRTTEMLGAEAVLEYRDALGLAHRHVLPMKQQRRDDGQYNFWTNAQEERIERPSTGNFEMWRLRNRA